MLVGLITAIKFILILVGLTWGRARVFLEGQRRFQPTGMACRTSKFLGTLKTRTLGYRLRIRNNRSLQGEPT